METYEIDISYSWGDEEEPVEIEAPDESTAFDIMLDMAVREIKTCFRDGQNECSYTLTVMPWNNQIILYYGYDDEECYYYLRKVN